MDKIEFLTPVSLNRGDLPAPETTSMQQVGQALGPLVTEVMVRDVTNGHLSQTGHDSMSQNYWVS